MKNLFDVNSDEIKRILTLHEERSKVQYLNIINEQSTSLQYTTTKQNCFDGSRCVPAGTKFVSLKNKGRDVAIAYGVKLNKQESPVNVMFYCKSPDYRFTVAYKSGAATYYNDLLKTSLLSKVCSGNQFGDPIAKTGTYNTPKQQPSTTPLTDEQKLSKAQSCGHNSWDEYKNSKWACYKQLDTAKINKVKNKNVVKPNIQQQFTQNTIASVNNVQKSLGVTPTGQLTTKDIDSLLTKLQ